MGEYVEKLIEKVPKIKNNIVEDIESVPVDDICFLIDVFKNDVDFSQYLINNLIQKLKAGKKLDFEQFVKALAVTI